MSMVDMCIGTSSGMVVLVDENDVEKGVSAKLDAHREGLLHRAFSIFVFRQGNDGPELLLQKRAESKYHSGGLWTNSCCSHPSPGESVEAAATRRMSEELGFNIPLTHAGTFSYRAKVASDLEEHEFDHVFYGFAEGNIRVCPDVTEISEITWATTPAILADLHENPHKYTAWFYQAFKLVLEHMKPDTTTQVWSCTDR